MDVIDPPPASARACEQDRFRGAQAPLCDKEIKIVTDFIRQVVIVSQQDRLCADRFEFRRQFCQEAF